MEEVLFGSISLAWVAGVLTLQGIDRVARDYSDGLKRYLVNGDDGVLQPTQLQAFTPLPDSEIYRYVNFLIAETERKGKEGLKRAQRFNKTIGRVKFGYEAGLLLLAVTMMAVTYIDFSGLHLPVPWTKAVFLCCLIATFLVVSLGIRHFLSWRYEKIKF